MAKKDSKKKPEDDSEESEGEEIENEADNQNQVMPTASWLNDGNTRDKMIGKILSLTSQFALEIQGELSAGRNVFPNVHEFYQ